MEERNWFFPLTKWAPRLLELYDEHTEFVRPRARYNEARSLIAGGLEDVSFSRATVSWGVPVPWEPEQTIYVWVDALLNYRTALEYGLGRDVTGEFWPTTLHLMAKDILRLHGIVWPAMLLAAGYEPPHGLFVHGYFTSAGQKMSKTLGNVIDPFEVIERLGPTPCASTCSARCSGGRTATSPGRASSAATRASSRTTSATSSRDPWRWSSAIAAAPSRKG